MEPIEYVSALIRRWPIVAVCAFIGALFAYLGTDPKPAPLETRYEATHTLLVNDSTFGTESQVGTITFAQVPVFATTGEVPRRASELLGFQGAPAALAADVDVTADDTTGTVTFTTEQLSATDAVAIADAFADQTVFYLAERQEELRGGRQTNAREDVERLALEIQTLDAQILEQISLRNVGLPEDADPVAADSVLIARRDAAVREYGTAYEADRAFSVEQSQDLNLTSLERAQPVAVQPGGFTAPRTRATRVPIAAGIGALLGIGIALIAERLDAKLRDRRKAEEAFGAAVVGELPTLSRKQRAARLVVGPEHHHAAAEAFRSLRTSITFMAAGGQPLADNDEVGIVLVTSPSPAEGKTTVAVNLAAAFAETGRSVVVVNADFRRPVVSNILVPRDRPPLPAGLAGIDRLDPAAFLVPTEVPSVELLDLSPLGGTPGDLTRATVRLATALSARVDVVIVDTPPLAVTTEALEFVPAAKVVVLVGRIGRTATASATRAGELVRFGGAEQIAIAITDAGSSALRRTKYYDYYGGRRARRQRDLTRSGAPIERDDDLVDDDGSDDDVWDDAPYQAPDRSEDTQPRVPAEIDNGDHDAVRAEGALDGNGTDEDDEWVFAEGAVEPDGSGQPVGANDADDPADWSEIDALVHEREAAESGTAHAGRPVPGQP